MTWWGRMGVYKKRPGASGLRRPSNPVRRPGGKSRAGGKNRDRPARPLKRLKMGKTSRFSSFEISRREKRSGNNPPPELRQGKEGFKKGLLKTAGGNTEKGCGPTKLWGECLLTATKKTFTCKRGRPITPRDVGALEGNATLFLRSGRNQREQPGEKEGYV